jgi:hypothetical protein
LLKNEIASIFKAGNPDFVSWLVCEDFLGLFNNDEISFYDKSQNSGFFNEIKKKFNEELIIKEKEQFANCIFGNLDNYKQKFGNFEQNLSRSGLKSMLDYDD